MMFAMLSLALTLGKFCGVDQWPPGNIPSVHLLTYNTYNEHTFLYWPTANLKQLI